jgi:hypothetical protein
LALFFVVYLEEVGPEVFGVLPDFVVATLCIGRRILHTFELNFEQQGLSIILQGFSSHGFRGPGGGPARSGGLKAAAGLAKLACGSVCRNSEGRETPRRMLCAGGQLLHAVCKPPLAAVLSDRQGTVPEMHLNTPSII